MNNVIKGTLLSGVVLPGLGQVVLKCYKRGIALMLIVLVCLGTLVVTAVRRALAILQQLDLYGGMVDIHAISSAAARASRPTDSLMFSALVLVILFCWVFSVIDAYRIGRKLDVQGGGAPAPSTPVSHS